jgi:putative endonuclease
MSAYHVYIMSNRTHRLYIGVTNDLMRRVSEHKARVAPGFTNKYDLNRLVYFEEAANPASAIAREKQLKGWLRAKKLALIEAGSPHWSDLSRGCFGADGASLRGDPSLRSG